MTNVSSGKILIADPFLRDPNFMRTVVVICEHLDTGSFGFVLNKEYHQHIGELIVDLSEATFPVYYGGPVQVDTIHFLHQCPKLITGGFEIAEGIYWGGDFEAVVELVKAKQLSYNDIRFFLGYSGWGEGQLEEEMKQKSWITSDASRGLIFRNTADEIWKDALKQLGGEYELMINYPIDPQLN